jgi:hypothetical protein
MLAAGWITEIWDDVRRESNQAVESRSVGNRSLDNTKGDTSLSTSCSNVRMLEFNG